MSGGHYVLLTDDEILLLDGKTDSKEIVGKIKVVKGRRALVSEGVPEWFAKVIVSATNLGKLDMHRRSGGGNCAKCGRRSTVYPLYKRGPKKGQRNHNKKPWQESRMVVAAVHFCQGCEKEALSEVRKLAEKGESRFEISVGSLKSLMVKEDKRICPKCGKECWDFDMGLKVTMMDPYGRYYGKCPHCDFESNLFGPSFKWTGKSRISKIADLEVVKTGRFTYYQRKKNLETVDE